MPSASGLRIQYILFGEPGVIQLPFPELKEQTHIPWLLTKMTSGNQFLEFYPSDEIPRLITALNRLRYKMRVYRTLAFRIKAKQHHLLSISKIVEDGLDGLAMGSDAKTCKLYNVRMNMLLYTLRGHTDRISSLLYSKPIGEHLVTGSYDYTSKLWCTETGVCLHTFLGHTGKITNVKFDPLHENIVSLSDDETAQRFNLETGEKVATLEGGHLGPVTDAAFVTENTLYTTGVDSVIRGWDLRVNKNTSVLFGHSGEITKCLYAERLNRLVTCSRDNTIKIWDMRQMSPSTTINAHDEQIVDMYLNQWTLKLLSASADNCAKMWDLGRGPSESMYMHTLRGHTNDVTHVAINTRGSLALTGSKDKTCRVWNVKTGVCLQVLEDQKDEITGALFNFDSDSVFTSSKDGTCNIYKNRLYH